MATVEFLSGELFLSEVPHLFAPMGGSVPESHNYIIHKHN